MPDQQLESERIEELTRALRGVMERVRTTRAPAEVLDRAVLGLRALDAELEAHSHPGPYQQTMLGNVTWLSIDRVHQKCYQFLQLRKDQ